ncbi:hypothetical protein CYMTET_28058, partial [Cymbomonas tetramitiformis]
RVDLAAVGNGCNPTVGCTAATMQELCHCPTETIRHLEASAAPLHAHLIGRGKHCRCQETTAKFGAIISDRDMLSDMYSKLKRSSNLSHNLTKIQQELLELKDKLEETEKSNRSLTTSLFTTEKSLSSEINTLRTELATALQEAKEFKAKSKQLEVAIAGHVNSPDTVSLKEFKNFGIMKQLELLQNMSLVPGAAILTAMGDPTLVEMLYERSSEKTRGMLEWMEDNERATLMTACHAKMCQEVLCDMPVRQATFTLQAINLKDRMALLNKLPQDVFAAILSHMLDKELKQTMAALRAEQRVAILLQMEKPAAMRAVTTLHPWMLANTLACEMSIEMQLEILNHGEPEWQNQILEHVPMLQKVALLQGGNMKQLSSYIRHIGHEAAALLTPLMDIELQQRMMATLVADDTTLSVQLIKSLDTEVRRPLLNAMPFDILQQLLEEMTVEDRGWTMEDMSDEPRTAALEKMSVSAAANIMDHIRPNALAQSVKLMEANKAAGAIAMMLRDDEGLAAVLNHIDDSAVMIIMGFLEPLRASSICQLLEDQDLRAALTVSVNNRLRAAGLLNESEENSTNRSKWKMAAVRGSMYKDQSDAPPDKSILQAMRFVPRNKRLYMAMQKHSKVEPHSLEWLMRFINVVYDVKLQRDQHTQSEPGKYKLLTLPDAMFIHLKNEYDTKVLVEEQAAYCVATLLKYQDQNSAATQHLRCFRHFLSEEWDTDVLSAFLSIRGELAMSNTDDAHSQKDASKGGSKPKDVVLGFVSVEKCTEVAERVLLPRSEESTEAFKNIIMKYSVQDDDDPTPSSVAAPQPPNDVKDGEAPERGRMTPEESSSGAEPKRFKIQAIRFLKEMCQELVRCQYVLDEFLQMQHPHFNTAGAGALLTIEDLGALVCHSAQISEEAAQAEAEKIVALGLEKVAEVNELDESNESQISVQCLQLGVRHTTFVKSMISLHHTPPPSIVEVHLGLDIKRKCAPTLAPPPHAAQPPAQMVDAHGQSARSSIEPRH